MTSTKLRGPWCQKVYFLKLHMRVYLNAKFKISIIILTSVRKLGEGSNFKPPSPTSKRTHKSPTHIRVKVNKIHIHIFISFPSRQLCLLINQTSFMKYLCYVSYFLLHTSYFLLLVYIVLILNDAAIIFLF